MDALKRLGREMQDERESMPPSDVVVDTTPHIVIPPSEDDHIPAVTVQAFEPDAHTTRTASTSPDITQVKATVESMRGGAEADLFAQRPDPSKRITPTGRPPLA